MKGYHLLSGGLNPIDYILIAGLVALALIITAIVVWRKVKGKGSCDCGGCPSARQNSCDGSCNSCTSCPSEREDKNA